MDYNMGNLSWSDLDGGTRRLSLSSNNIRECIEGNASSQVASQCENEFRNSESLAARIVSVRADRALSILQLGAPQPLAGEALDLEISPRVAETTQVVVDNRNISRIESRTPIPIMEVVRLALFVLPLSYLSAWAFVHEDIFINFVVGTVAGIVVLGLSVLALRSNRIRFSIGSLLHTLALALNAGFPFIAILYVPFTLIFDDAWRISTIVAIMFVIPASIVGILGADSSEKHRAEALRERGWRTILITFCAILPLAIWAAFCFGWLIDSILHGRENGLPSTWLCILLAILMSEETSWEAELKATLGNVLVVISVVAGGLLIHVVALQFILEGVSAVFTPMTLVLWGIMAFFGVPIACSIAIVFGVCSNRRKMNENPLATIRAAVIRIVLPMGTFPFLFGFVARWLNIHEDSQALLMGSVLVLLAAIGCLSVYRMWGVADSADAGTLTVIGASREWYKRAAIAGTNLIMHRRAA